VNVFGDFTKPTGLGVAARHTATALETAGCRVTRRDLEALTQLGPPDLWSGEGVVNVLHTNPDRLASLCSSRDAPLRWIFATRRAYVAYWAWEARAGIPDSWKRFRAYVGEVWVPSQFTAQAVARHLPCPVVCMPHAVTVSPPDSPRSAFSALCKGAVFLTIFDALSGFSRKNPLGLIEAWKLAFPIASGDATLIIKCAGLGDSHRSALSSACGGRSDIAMISGSLAAHELHALMHSASAYVSLHRTEGFGLTMAEAMLYGKPVIATGYSGNLDFMNAKNAYLVDYTLTRLSADDGYYRAGTEWADPDVQDAARQIRAVFENPDRARSVGERARATIAEALSPAAVGLLMRERLDLLAAHNCFSISDRQKISAT